jgi:hypothetical protein
MNLLFLQKRTLCIIRRNNAFISRKIKFKRRLSCTFTSERKANVLVLCFKYPVQHPVTEKNQHPNPIKQTNIQ